MKKVSNELQRNEKTFFNLKLEVMRKNFINSSQIFHQVKCQWEIFSPLKLRSSSVVGHQRELFYALIYECLLAKFFLASEISRSRVKKKIYNLCKSFSFLSCFALDTNFYDRAREKKENFFFWKMNFKLDSNDIIWKAIPWQWLYKE
jgi:hypothetical protein